MLRRFIKSKSELIYKVSLGLFVVTMMIALYLNNEEVIDRAKKAFSSQSQPTVASTNETGSDGFDFGTSTETTVASASLTVQASSEPEPVTSPVTAASTTEIATSVSVLVSATTEDRSLNFALSDKFGQQTLFSEYRGEIVFMTFWSSKSADTMLETIAQKDKLTAASAEYSGDTAVRFITVFVPEIDTVTSGTVTENTNLDGSVVGNGVDADFFLDEDGSLSRLFMLREYPTTFVFYANGGLCDYFPSAPDIAISEEYTKKAAKGGAHNEVN